VTEWHSNTRLLGRRVLVFPTLESTSTFAATLAGDRSNDGLVVLAREQTAGRGQHGRSWQCPAEAGVLLSVLLFPPPELLRPALLTAWAAVSVCNTVRRLTRRHCRIKWPNDVLLGHKKVAGILIEQGRGTVAGIGLNVNQTAAMFEQAGLTEATSLALVDGRLHDWEETARLLIAELDQEYKRLLDGDWANLENRWRRRLGLVGSEVEMECLDGMRQGRLLHCAFSGLRLETSQGMETILPEKVKHLSRRSVPAV
jgi:BirA family biotin operon repressor/biotin-[acetyl-CoA-carboxylase] ligase